MTAQHSSYEELAAQRRDSDQYREGYAEARRAFGRPLACPHQPDVGRREGSLVKPLRSVAWRASARP